MTHSEGVGIYFQFLNPIPEILHVIFEKKKKKINMKFYFYTTHTLNPHPALLDL